MMWGIQGIGGLAIRELISSCLFCLSRTELRSVLLFLLRPPVFYGYDQGVMSGINNNPEHRVRFRFLLFDASDDDRAEKGSSSRS